MGIGRNARTTIIPKNIEGEKMDDFSVSIFHEGRGRAHKLSM
jgi:hypothetical protein